MKRHYTVSEARNERGNKIWYAHMIGFPYIPYQGSFCYKKSEAEEYAKMCDGLPHHVDRIEKRYKADDT